MPSSPRGSAARKGVAPLRSVPRKADPSSDDAVAQTALRAFRRDVPKVGLASAIAHLPGDRRAHVVIEPARERLEMLGGAYSLDSSAFMAWVAVNIKQVTILRVLLLMIAKQEYGGSVRITQKQLGEILKVQRQHVNAALGELFALNVVRMVKRGRYQLHPAASFRGNGRQQAEAFDGLAEALTESGVPHEEVCAIRNLETLPAERK